MAKMSENSKDRGFLEAGNLQASCVVKADTVLSFGGPSPKLENRGERIRTESLSSDDRKSQSQMLEKNRPAGEPCIHDSISNGS